MEIIVPLAAKFKTALRSRIEQTRIIQIAFGDDVDRPSRAPRHVLGHFLQVAEDVTGTKIVDGVDRIEPQAIEMKLFHPHAGVVQNEIAHGVGAGTIEVDGQSPRRLVAVGEVGPELGEVIAFGPEVVVNDIEKDRQPGRVAGIDQLLQTVRSAVAILRGVRKYAIVTPVPAAGKLSDRHQLQRPSCPTHAGRSGEG